MAKNAEQADYWSSASGRKWLTFEEEFDIVFEAVNEALIERARPQPGEKAIDIGCGTGATTRAFAEHLAPGGFVAAVDIAPPMIERARSQAHEAAVPTTYRLADAQSDAIEDAPFDLVFSRFGVMFFAETAAAFANIRAAMRSGGRFCAAAWAPMKGNPWFEAPRDGAVARLGPPAPSDPAAPGPLAFQDADRVVRLLTEAGFSDAAAETTVVVFRHPGPLERVAALASNIGPAARILKQYGGGEADVAAIRAHVCDAFSAYDTPHGVRLPATLHFFTAIAP